MSRPRLIALLLALTTLLVYLPVTRSSFLNYDDDDYVDDNDDDEDNDDDYDYYFSHYSLYY